MFFPTVLLFAASVVASNTRDKRLNMFIRRFEPVYFDPVHRSHPRAKRSVDAGGSGDVRVQIRSSRRSLNLHLTADASVFHKNLVVESSTEGIVNVDTSHIYKGYVIGKPRSRVFGSLYHGVFEGSIETSSGDSFYVERASRFFNDSRPYHSVLYSSADIEFPTLAGGHWCGLHGSTEQWMRDTLRRLRHVAPQKRHPAVSRVGRKLHAYSEAIDDDENERHDRSTAKYNEPIGEEERDTTVETQHEELDDSRDYAESTKKARSKNKYAKPAKPRQESLSRRVCNLEIVVDNTFTDSILQDTDSVMASREIATSVVAHLVNKVNSIYGGINFDGIEDISFVVQHIMISEPGDCVGYKAKQDPLCSTSLDPAQLLYLVSLTRHDDYCLSFRLNFRDFADGTLGLAWIAGEETGTGGICERYRSSVEYDPVRGEYRQAKMSLNCGITTLINQRQYVGLLIGSLTLAHEIGHSFGSPHDHGPICEPEGPQGKYIMYASATRGDRPNNDRFSPCSIVSMSAILKPLFDSETSRENCFLRHSGPVCGNQIVEGDEQCDCGTTEAECTDKCCYSRNADNRSLACRLKPSAKCSPTAGACCTESCDFMPKGELCSEETECTEESYCDGTRAKCPDAPAKANMTACNKNTQVCLSGECQGSVCEKYGLLECFRKAEGLSISEQCLLTCQAPGSKECEVACAFPIMASHCGAKLQPGSPCNDMRGYCDIFHKCRRVEPRGFLTRLQGFFLGGQSVDTLYEFVAHHPFTACIVVLSSSWFMVLVFRCFAVHTHSSNPLKQPPFKLKDTLRHPIQSLVTK